MTAENFIYWLNGYLEISNAKELNEEQLQTVKDHIKLVLTKVTPPLWIDQGNTITIPSYPSNPFGSGGTIIC